jgi:uncharacterized membrane protein
MKTSRTQNVFRIILGIMMVLPGIGHLTFQRKEFLAQVPPWLSDNPAFLDFVVVASGILKVKNIKVTSGIPPNRIMC